MSALTRETLKFFGTVRQGGVELGSCFCELTADPHAPRDMRAVLHVDYPSDWAARLLDGREVEVSKPGVVATIKDPAWRMGMDGRATVSAAVHKVWKGTQYSTADSTSRIDVYYSFPLTGLTVPEPKGGQKHWRLGLIRSASQPDEPLVIPELEEVDFLGAQVRYGDNLNFYSGGEKRYPQEVIVRESVLNVTGAVVTDLSEAISTAQSVADAFLRLVSLVDRDRIHWTSEKVVGEDGDGGLTLTNSTVRWASPPREWFSTRPEGDRAGTLRNVCAAYSSLGKQERNEVDRALGEFEIAHCAPTLESSLLYWHSVLDFMSTRLDPDKKVGISRRLLRLCDEREIEVADLAPPEIIDGMRKGTKPTPQFPFTELRNEFTHGGFDAFHGRPHVAVRGGEQARALAERLLLSMMGLDYRSTTLGRIE